MAVRLCSHMYNCLNNLHILWHFPPAKDYFTKVSHLPFNKSSQNSAKGILVCVCVCTCIGVYPEMITRLQTASFSWYLHMAENRAEEASSLMILTIRTLIPFMKSLPLRPHLISVTSQRPQF